MSDTQNTGGWPDAARPGVPMHPERDGWHWLQHRIESKPVPHPWITEIAAWASGAAYTPEGVVELGWRYVGPCLTPAEVEAEKAAARREGIEAALAVCRTAAMATANDHSADGPPAHSAVTLVEREIRALLKETPETPAGEREPQGPRAVECAERTPDAPGAVEGPPQKEAGR